MTDSDEQGKKNPGLEIPPDNDRNIAWEILGSGKTLAQSPSKRLAELKAQEERLSVEQRLAQAAVRREEFRSWVLKKAQTKRPTRKKPEERGAARLEKLRERQMAAEAVREAALEAVRMRAATFLARREGALARVNERQETLASRVFESLAAADERRSSLQEAERERLKVEHDTVLARLATSRAEAPAELEEARKKLEDRLLAAEEARAATLAQVAARAGEQVQHARDVSALTRQLKLEALTAKRASAEARMMAARQRRTMLGQTTPPLSPSSISPPCPSPAPSLATDQTDSTQVDTVSGSVAAAAGGFVSVSTLVDLPQPQQDGGSMVLDGPMPERAAQEAGALEQAVAEEEIAGAEVAEAEKELAEALASVDEPAEALTKRGLGKKASFPTSFPITTGNLDVSLTGSEDGGSDIDEGANQARAHEVLETRMEAFRRSCSTRKLQAAWRTFAHKRHTTDVLARAFVDTGAISPALKAALQAQEQLPRSPLGQPSQQGQQQSQQRPPAPPLIIGAPSIRGNGASPSDATPLEAARGLDTFDAFASIVQAPRTLRAASALLHRLEARLVHTTPGIKEHGTREKGPQPNHSGGGASQKSVDKLLRRLFPSLPKDRTLDRYPPRIFLCALMIQHHPEVVFNGSGPRESALAAAARDMSAAFDELVLRILDPPPTPGLPPKAPSSSTTKFSMTSDVSQGVKFEAGAGKLGLKEEGVKKEEERPGSVATKSGGKWSSVEDAGGQSNMVAASPVARSMLDYRHSVARGNSGGVASTVGQLLVCFDEAWLHYLDQFAAWKLEDAASLEAELVRVAADMERSMQRKLARSGAAATAAATGASPQGSPVTQQNLLLARSARNLDAVVAQVAHDHRLLRERVARLSGAEGLNRLEQALDAVRASVAREAAGNDWESDMGYISEAPSDSEPNTTSASPSPRRVAVATAGGPSSASASPRKHQLLQPSATDVQQPAPEAQGSTAGRASQQQQGQPRMAPLPVRSSSGIRRGFFGAAPAPTAPPSTAAAPTATSSAATASAADAPVPIMVSDVRAPSAYPPSQGSASSSPSRSSGSPGAFSGSGQSSPGAATPTGGQFGVEESISNLQLVWEVVHNPRFSLGSGEAEASWARACLPEGEQQKLPTLLDEDLEREGVDAAVAVVKARAIAIAEAAFWDHVTERLTVGLLEGNLAQVVVPLLSQLGTDLAGVLSDPNAAASLHAEFGEEALQQSVASGESGTGTAGVLTNAAGALQRGAHLLILYGAPSREEDCKAAHAVLQAEVVSAMEAWMHALSGQDKEVFATASKRMARSLARALRLLLAQLKLLKMDSANVKFAGLARQMQGQAGIDYLRTKFASLHRIPLMEPPSGPAPGPESHPTLASHLPRTAAWLHHTSLAATGVRGYLASVGLNVDAPQVMRTARQAADAAAAAATTNLPTNIRSGLHAPAHASASSSSTANEEGSSVIHPVVPVALGSWRGRVRGGVVALIAAEQPAVSPALAETLAWDAERLHSAQNAFQQLVVVIAGMLLVQQTRAAAGRPAWGPAQATAARQRLMVVLADPSMDLADLVSELTRLSRLPPAENTEPASPWATTLRAPGPSYTPHTAAGGAADSATGAGISAATSTQGHTDAAAQGAAGDTAAGSVEDEERSMRRAFSTLMSTNGAAFRSISNAIAAALAVRLLLGPAVVDSPIAADSGSEGGGVELAARHAVTQLLGRVGASALAPDVAALARKLLAVCAVSEAVHGPIYAALAPRDEVAQGPDQQGGDEEGPRGGANPVAPPPSTATGASSQPSVQESRGAAAV